MRVQLVSLKATKAATAAGRHALVPELLASAGASYSRNNEGLEAILARFNPDDDENAAVQRIFRFVDYGHKSIGDMTPVAIFMDGVSIWLAWYVWSLCPLAMGQESSTRYIAYDGTGLIDDDLTELTRPLRQELRERVAASLRTYQRISQMWEEVARARPEVMRLPADLLREAAAEADPQGKATKQVDRLRRNFTFDRSRYWLPAAALTNFMMIQPGTEWARLVRILASHPLAEARGLAEKLQSELALVVPQLLRHAVESDDWTAGHYLDMEVEQDCPFGVTEIQERNDPAVTVDVMAPRQRASIGKALDCHPHRYSWVGKHLQRWMVRYTVEGVAFAELRDLNRHKTGFKYQPMTPMGFYGARDQLAAAGLREETLDSAISLGLDSARRQAQLLRQSIAGSVYFALLGTQVVYERGTTLDKLIYEIELRTGRGAHWRYAEHMRKVHDALVRRVPELAGKILLGSAEPE